MGDAAQNIWGAPDWRRLVFNIIAHTLTQLSAEQRSLFISRQEIIASWQCYEQFPGRLTASMAQKIAGESAFYLYVAFVIEAAAAS